jgi:hypothetical protein
MRLIPNVILWAGPSAPGIAEGKSGGTADGESGEIVDGALIER